MGGGSGERNLFFFSVAMQQANTSRELYVHGVAWRKANAIRDLLTVFSSFFFANHDNMGTLLASLTHKHESILLASGYYLEHRVRNGIDSNLTTGCLLSMPSVRLRDVLLKCNGNSNL